MKQPPASRLILKDNAPAYLGVRRALVERIGRECKVGDRLPPISELARSMGVGQNNAQRAVRELVAEGILFSRRRLGLFVRELPSDAAEQTHDAQTPLMGKLIGMATAAVAVPFIERMMEGFTQVIREAGGKTAVIPDVTQKDVVPDPTGYWGVALFNPGINMQPPADKRNIVIVSTADHIHPDLIARFDMVSVDQYQGGALAGMTLVKKGLKDACFLGRPLVRGTKRLDLTSSTRLHGFESAWGSHLKASRLIHVEGYSTNSGRKAFATWQAMSPRPQAIFAASDELAVGFVETAISQGLKPEKDFTIIGFDGQDRNLPESFKNTAIMTVRVPALEMGRRAAQLMLRREADPTRPTQRILLPCTISTIKPV